MNNIEYDITEVDAELIGVKGVGYKYKRNIIIVINSNTINKNVIRVRLIQELENTNRVVL